MDKISLNFEKNVIACFNNYDLVNIIVREAVALKNNPEPHHKGGYLAVYDVPTANLICSPFGVIRHEEMHRYCRWATEKVTRLIGNGEKRSFTSRDEKLDRWGGGVHYGPTIAAFSGSDEFIDEAISLVYAVYRSHEMFNGSNLLLQDYSEGVVIDVTTFAEQHFKNNPFIIELANVVFVGKQVV